MPLPFGTNCAINGDMLLQEWRLSQNKSRKELAAEIGAHDARSIQRWEDGECIPRLQFRYRLLHLSKGKVTSSDLEAPCLNKLIRSTKPTKSRKQGQNGQEVRL